MVEMKRKKSFKDADVPELKRITDGEMNELVNKAVQLIEPELKNQFYYFKDSKIDYRDFLSYLANVISKISMFFVANAESANPEIEYQFHVMALIRAICTYHGITLHDTHIEDVPKPLH